MPQQPNGAVVPPNRAPEQPKAPYAQPYQAEPDGAGETTLLDSGAGETTLLNGAGSAYLMHEIQILHPKSSMSICLSAVFPDMDLTELRLQT